MTIPIPSERSRDEVQAALDRYQDWFYDFRFANGAEAVVKSELVRAIRDTKPDLIFPHLDHLFRGRWGDIQCLDMACHQGWFSVQTALRGPASVHGIDVLALRPGSDVLLFGAGPTGLVLGQLLARGGAARLTVAAPTAFKRELARAYGADETVQMRRDDPAAAASRLRRAGRAARREPVRDLQA